MGHKSREIQMKLMRGLLDFVILQFLKSQPMHGYQIISTLRKSFGVYFGPSTIYPLLSTLEGKGYLKSKWDLEKERPRKVYNLTPQGEDMLNCTKVSLNQIHMKLTNGINKPSLNVLPNHRSLKAPKI
jgi:DNA-binding PadR family transcriptional regulator